MKRILRILLIAFSFIAIQACNLPSDAPPTPTLDLGIPVTGHDSPTPDFNPTVTPATPPTLTALVLQVEHTLTPVTPSPTRNATATVAITPGVVQVRVNAPTNCRAGPSLAYENVWILQVKDVAEVIGRNERGNYWMIRIPGRPSETCWIWGRYATLEGDTSVVIPILTPLPVNKLGFDASYQGLGSCPGTGWWVNIELKNTGRLSFKSITLTVRDTDTGVTLTQSTNGFGFNNNCSGFQARDELPPESSFVVSAPAFTYNISRHRIRATMTLCSEVAQSGTCVPQEIFFTPQ